MFVSVCMFDCLDFCVAFNFLQATLGIHRLAVSHHAVRKNKMFSEILLGSVISNYNFTMVRLYKTHYGKTVLTLL